MFAFSERFIFLFRAVILKEGFTLRFTAKLLCIFVVCAALALSFTAVSAAPTVSLNWYKNNGYGLGSDIGGQWTITADASSDVTRVEFYLDNQLQQNDTSAPFNWVFDTADFNLGEHTIKAVAYNVDGQTATAQADRNFVEYSAANVFGIIIGVVVAVMAVVLIALLYRVRKKRQ